MAVAAAGALVLVSLGALRIDMSNKNFKGGFSGRQFGRQSFLD